MPGYGRTGTPTLKVARRNGPTDDDINAFLTHASLGVPAAAPVTVTDSTFPLEPNSTSARDGAGIPFTHCLAALIRELSAL